MAPRVILAVGGGGGSLKVTLGPPGWWLSED